MGTDNGGSIQYGYTFEILNTSKMGHLKKSCSHIPSRMDLSQTPGVGIMSCIGRENQALCNHFMCIFLFVDIHALGYKCTHRVHKV